MSNEVFHECRVAGRTFTREQWGEYCRETRIDPSKRIVTHIGKYDFNDCDMCLNPEVMTLAVDRSSYGYYVTLKWADCGNGLWAYAIDYCTGTGGGGYGVCWADHLADGSGFRHRGGYRSEQDAILAACDEAVIRLQQSGHDNEEKTKRLIRMVEDYKKQIRPRYVQLELF